MAEQRRRTQRKQGHKDKKCERGKPLLYSEMKERMALSLTPTSKRFLEKLAEQEMCSVSEVIECGARGRLRTKLEEVIAVFSEACLLHKEVIERMALSLTPTAKRCLGKLAEQEMCSISELIERWVGCRLHTKPEEVIALLSEACLPLVSEQFLA